MQSQANRSRHPVSRQLGTSSKDGAIVGSLVEGTTTSHRRAASTKPATLGTSSSHTKGALKEFADMLFETDLIIDNTTSEPRDILMTERTALSWVKFSVTLSAIAITIITNFRLDTSGDGKKIGDGEKDTPPWFAKFSYAISILFVLLSMATLFIGCLSYFQSIYNYKEHMVNTYSLKTTLGFLFIVGLILLAVNIVFVATVR